MEEFNIGDIVQLKSDNAGGPRYGAAGELAVIVDWYKTSKGGVRIRLTNTLDHRGVERGFLRENDKRQPYAIVNNLIKLGPVDVGDLEDDL